ncbi:unnamed protein product [Phytomonas sp. EM1]|nr:unnamed protein product [Phytomonas sp. EM1]|eukprot:CCW59677.1 unnamed protein product [Phytomonas sp. isolate EM1]
MKVESVLREHHVCPDEESTEGLTERFFYKLFNRFASLTPTPATRVSSPGGELKKCNNSYAYADSGASRTSKTFKERLGALLNARHSLQRRMHSGKDCSGATVCGVATATAVSEGCASCSDVETRSLQVLDSSHPKETMHAQDSLQFAITDPIQFLAINTDENERLTSLHDVRNIPTFIAYFDGYIIASAEGANEMGLCKLVRLLAEEAEGQKEKGNSAKQ